MRLEGDVGELFGGLRFMNTRAEAQDRRVTGKP